jgi:hypothetical protein
MFKEVNNGVISEPQTGWDAQYNDLSGACAQTSRRNLENA